MAKKKEDQTLPLSVENDTEPSSSITYASEVIAIIAGLAASEVEGIAGMCSVNNGLKTKNKNVTRGVKVEVGTEEVSVELYLNVEYGTPIQRAAHDVQECVKKGIENMTGLHVVRVDVHVLGVSFEKENSALIAGAGNAVLEAGETGRADAESKEGKKQEQDSRPGKKREPKAEKEQEADVTADAGEPARAGENGAASGDMSETKTENISE